MLKAINGLARGRAPGPDGLQAELFQGLTCLLVSLKWLFNCIVMNGRFPRSLTRLYVVPLDKPGKDASLCGSKRPISLICVVAKALEAAVLHRLMAPLELTLNGEQYAYRRDRGTGLHLSQLYDFVSGELAKGKYVYLAAIDIDGAPDNVPHEGLVGTLRDAKTDPILVRYVARWLRGRIFCVRLRTAAGTYNSRWCPLTRGLPQGGFLSPFLWLLHVNPFHSHMEELAGGNLGRFGELEC